jgi:hypothetical protein
MRSHFARWASLPAVVLAGCWGQPGRESCTVDDEGDGATITCSGQTIEVRGGGPTPTCTIEDNGDGTATISCPDGTTTLLGPVLVPALLMDVAGDDNLRAGERSSLPYAVQVTSSDGTPVPHTTVFFSVRSGPITVEASLGVTDAFGMTYTYARALSSVGPAVIEAEVFGLESGLVTFEVDVRAAPPDSLEVVSGEEQVAVVGTALTAPLTVRVRDRYGNPVVGEEVFFSPGPSAGALSPASTFADAGGNASAIWTLGTIAGVQTARARAGSEYSVWVSADAEPGPPAIIVPDTAKIAGAVGRVLRPAARFNARDEYGNGVPNILINVAISGAGIDLLQDEVLSNAAGTVTLVATPSELGDSLLTASAGELTGNISVRVFTDVVMARPESTWDAIRLGWSATGDLGFLGYDVYRAAMPGQPVASATLVGALSGAAQDDLIDSSGTLRQLYFYRIVTRFADGYALESLEVSGRPGVWIELGGAAFDMELSSDASTLYVSIATENQIIVIDLTTFWITERIQMPALPQGISLDDSGTMLYVALRTSGSVAQIELATSTVTVFPLGTLLGNSATFDVQALADETVLVTADPDSSGFAYVVRLDPATGAGVRVANGRIIRARPTFARVSGDDFVYVGEGFSPNSLYKLDTAQDSAPIVLEDDHGSVSGTGALAVSPTGSRIYIASGQVLNTTTLNDLGTTTAGFPLLSAEGGRVFVATNGAYYWDFTGNAGPEIRVFETATFTEVGRFNAGASIDRMLFLVDGMRILAINDNIVFGVSVPELE